MDDDTLTSQFFMFFTAGFETVASGSMFCIFEAASNQEIQEKLRKEIRTVIASNDGKITYDCVKQMSYLDNFVNGIYSIYEKNMKKMQNFSQTFLFRMFKKIHTVSIC